MKHLSEEQSMEFLYGEMPSSQRQEVQHHLRECPVCQEQFRELERARSTLDKWRVEIHPQSRIHPRRSILNWAAAAAILLAATFVTGRMTSTAVSFRDLDERIRSQSEKNLQALRDELKQDLATHLEQAAKESAITLANRNKAEIERISLAMAALQEEQKKAIYAALREIQVQHINDYRKLRQELETVAYNTDESLRTAQRQMVRLASSTENNQY